MSVGREQVYKAIDGERDYQDEKWGPTPKGGKHTPIEFLVFLQEYISEAISQGTRVAHPEGTDLVLDTIRKITAMGVACMEQHGAPRR